MSSENHGHGESIQDEFMDGDAAAKKWLWATLIGVVLFSGTVFAFILPNAG
jgi:hypothetical protein